MKRAVRALAWLAGALVACGLGFIAAPLPEGLLDERALSSVRVLDRHGVVLRDLKSPLEARGVPVRLAEVPLHVQRAFLAAEDSGFFAHAGLSPSAIARAFLQNVEAGRVVAGGSTITQQLARRLVPRPRTLLGKAQEALWALRLEAHLSKEQILEQYLNRAAFGHGAVGVGAAAESLLGTSVSRLSLGQAALLAALLRGPSAYDPFRHPERLERRRQWVLARLSRLGELDSERIRVARDEVVQVAKLRQPFDAPHFVELVRSKLRLLGGRDATVVETTLDAELQAEVERQVKEEVSRLGARRVGNAAVLVIDNATREVLAYVGSADFFSEQAGGQNDGVQMKRQPGSALKPFVYAEAFRRGFTPATVIPDVDIAFGSTKGSYAPKNYDRRLHGPVRAREALGSSYNVPAVRVAHAVGLPNTLQVLRRAGFESLKESAEHYGLGLALGNGEVSLWELGRAYSGLANGGVLAPLKVVRRATDASGALVSLEPDGPSGPFADGQAVELVTHVLADNAARARAFGLDNTLRLPFAVAAKTGTSKGYSDNWTIGYTKERTVAVWAGNFDGAPMVQVSGITGAGPVFKRVMLAAMASVAPSELVDLSGLVSARICPLSGHKAGPSCPATIDDFFVKGHEPTQLCQRHGQVSAGLPAELHERCAELSRAHGRVVDLGLEYYDWAKNEGLAREPWLAALCMRAARETEVAILHPAKGDEFMLFDDLPPADQAIPLRVRAPPAAGVLQVLLDGHRVLALPPPYTGRLPATKGRHRVTIIDEAGEALAETSYVVRR